MPLWIHWWNAIWLLRPGCSRLRTFLWFAVCVAGLTVRTDLLGVTSIVRALGLHGRCYHRLLDHFHGTGIRLDKMSALWTQVVLRLFPDPLRVNDRLILVGDGIKVPKCGKKMPAVKSLHQDSESNTKPEYIMGHSLQASRCWSRPPTVCLPCPWLTRIHEGLVWSNRDKRSLLDKMLALLSIVDIREPFYFVADAYYASHKIINGLLEQDNHLVTRVRSNAVAYTRYEHQGIPTKEAGPGSTARKLCSGHCSAMSRRWKKPPAPSMARTMSPSSIGSVICCGGPLDDSCASWWSFIPAEGAAC